MASDEVKVDYTGGLKVRGKQGRQMALCASLFGIPPRANPMSVLSLIMMTTAATTSQLHIFFIALFSSRA